jgi:hypothetical protein
MISIRHFLNIVESVRAYHGTRSLDLMFKMGHTGENAHTFGDYTSTRYGAFFTDNPDFAGMYGEVGEYVLDIKRTANLEGREGHSLHTQFIETIDAFKQRDLWLAATHTKHTWQMFEGDLGKRFVAFLKKLGYDSATFEEYNEDDGGTEHKSQTIVVLVPRLIRKA